VALLLTVASPFVAGMAEEHPTLLTLAMLMPLASLVIWTSILAVLGYGMRYLTTRSPRLSYANEAVLPIYILHQPVILAVGYFVVPLALPILVKYLIILALAFGITFGLYEFGVRRWNPVRRLFGLKPRRPAVPTAGFVAEPVS
jgi:peptidoglycan/LPS O-acetylase OafA/YrhL